MNITYEILTNYHIPELSKFYMETYNSPPWNEKWTMEAATQKLDELINCRDSYGLAAVDENGNIIGMIVGISEGISTSCYNIRQFCIRDFLVITSMHGNGIGSELMAELESHLKAMGIGRTYLITSSSNGTNSFYLKQGYTNIEGLVLMGKDLK